MFLKKIFCVTAAFAMGTMAITGDIDAERKLMMESAMASGSAFASPFRKTERTWVLKNSNNL